jgi:hypothetical protein
MAICNAIKKRCRRTHESQKHEIKQRRELERDGENEEKKQREHENCKM